MTVVRFFEDVERHVEECELCKRGPCKMAEALWDAAHAMAVVAMGLDDGKQKAQA